MRLAEDNSIRLQRCGPVSTVIWPVMRSPPYKSTTKDSVNPLTVPE